MEFIDTLITLGFEEHAHTSILSNSEFIKKENKITYR